jgi:hypothetical protein
MQPQFSKCRSDPPEVSFGHLSDRLYPAEFVHWKRIEPAVLQVICVVVPRVGEVGQFAQPFANRPERCRLTYIRIGNLLEMPKYFAVSVRRRAGCFAEGDAAR